MGARENRVQAACLGLLAASGCWCWRANSGAVCLPGVGGRRPRHVAFGVPGQADILGIIGRGPHRGRFLAVECKAPAMPADPLGGRRSKAGGRQSPAQAEFQRRVEEAGGVYILTDSSLALEDQLRRLAALG